MCVLILVKNHKQYGDREGIGSGALRRGEGEGGRGEGEEEERGRKGDGWEGRGWVGWGLFSFTRGSGWDQLLRVMTKLPAELSLTSFKV